MCSKESELSECSSLIKDVNGTYTSHLYGGYDMYIHVDMYVYVFALHYN